MLNDDRKASDTTVGMVGRLLEDWLGRQQWEPIEVVRLLIGDDLPAVGSGDEPYLWLLRGLSTGADRADREPRLAQRLGEFIDQQPEVHLPGPRPEQMLFNLLSLCAEMNRPDELSGPLNRMFERRALTGDWDGISLRGRLRAALASNQADSHLETVWQNMAEGEIDFLPGSRFQGLDGILLMPILDGEPPVDSIAAALVAIARLLDKDSKREQVFSRLLERADRTYQAGPLVICDLVWWAFYDSWPGWARECLTLKVPERDGVREFIREAGVEYERSSAQPLAFAIRAATQIQLAIRNYDRRTAQVLLNKRYERLRDLRLVA